MIRKGAKGQSRQEQLDAKERLDKKIREFAEKIKKVKDPNKDMLTDFFSKGELEALWHRLQKARGRKDLQVREAWDALKEMGANKADEARKNTLVMFITGVLDEDDDSWAEHLLTIKDTITKSRTLKVKQKYYYPGELRVKHGKKEAERMMKHKLTKTVDEDGDECYIRKEKQDISEKTRAQSIQASRHGVVHESD